MNRICLLATLLLLTGCGVQPSGARAGADAPTGIAPGVTLYFVGQDDTLRPQLRKTRRLGTISDALALLLTGPGGSNLRTEIWADAVPQFVVTTTRDVIELKAPLTTDDVSPLGIDQIVCTALGVEIQSGGSKSTRVRIEFVQTTPASDVLRTCPLFR